jgi:hypothetical protein
LVFDFGIDAVRRLHGKLAADEVFPGTAGGIEQLIEAAEAELGIRSP